MTGFGYKIERTNSPLTVVNPVLMAIAIIGIFPFCGCLASIHLVPALRTEDLESSYGLKIFVL